MDKHEALKALAESLGPAIRKAAEAMQEFASALGQFCEENPEAAYKLYRDSQLDDRACHSPESEEAE